MTPLTPSKTGCKPSVYRRFSTLTPSNAKIHSKQKQQPRTSLGVDGCCFYRIWVLTERTTYNKVSSLMPLWPFQ